MQSNKTSLGSNIIIKNREEIEINGINKVYSLNDVEFIIDTKNGNLKIEGGNLSMDVLDLNKGLIKVIGKINKVEYLDKENIVKKKHHKFANIFKWLIR